MKLEKYIKIKRLNKLEILLKKVDKNGKRVYKNIDGVNVRVSD